MAEILKSSGTTHLSSPTHSPESNGLAERQNRTLKDTARTLLQQSRLPTSFWTKTVNAACQIRNRCSHSSINVSRHEAFFGEKPSLDHIPRFRLDCLHPHGRRTSSCPIYMEFTLYKRRHCWQTFEDVYNFTIHENEFCHTSRSQSVHRLPLRLLLLLLPNYPTLHNHCTISLLSKTRPKLSTPPSGRLFSNPPTRNPGIKTQSADLTRINRSEP